MQQKSHATGLADVRNGSMKAFFKALSTSEKWRHPANDTQLKYGEMTGSLHA